MKKNTSFKEKAKYKFDNFVSRGTLALISWLGILSLLVIVIFAFILLLLGQRPHDNEEFGIMDSIW